MENSSSLAAVKGLRKKKKVRSKAHEFQGARKRRRATMVKPDSKSSGFDKIPEDVLMNILARLPAKVVVRSMCVSQLWYSVIASRYFIKLFLESPSSAKRLRLLVSLVAITDQCVYAFLSSSSPLDDHSDTTTAVDQVLNMPGMGGYLVSALRGLLCVRLGTRVRICNLTTKQRVTLPMIRSRLLGESNDNMCTSFAHDPVHDEYKVLNTVWEVSKEDGVVVRSEHQVFVLGSGASWRNTRSRRYTYPHRPYSTGMTIDGVFYYGSWIDRNKCVVMSFDLASEDFSLIELPVEAGIIWHARRANVVNYRGKLAVLEYSRLASDGRVDLWVMEDAGKSKWSNKTLVLNLSHLDGDELAFIGTGRSGEVWLEKTAQPFLPKLPRSYLIYDLEKNKIARRIELSPLPQHLWYFGLDTKGVQTALWEDDGIESIMSL